MKHLSKVCAAVVGMAGCMGNCIGDPADPITNVYQQTVTAETIAVVNIDLQGNKEEFSLFDEKGNPQTKELILKIEGLNNTKLKVELDDALQMINSKVYFKKLEDGTEVDDDKAVCFALAVVDSESNETQFEDDGTAQLENEASSKAGAKTNFKIRMKAESLEADTQRGKYQAGTLKFSFVAA